MFPTASKLLRIEPEVVRIPCTFSERQLRFLHLIRWHLVRVAEFRVASIAGCKISEPTKPRPPTGEMRHGVCACAPAR